MKSYDDLTDAEKDKLRMYILARSSTNSSLRTLVIVATAMYIPGIILIFAKSIELFMLGGMLIAMSILTILYVLKMKEDDDKYFTLAFGVTSYMRDIFHIKKSDINAMRKKWVLPKRKKIDGGKNEKGKMP